MWSVRPVSGMSFFLSETGRSVYYALAEGRVLAISSRDVPVVVPYSSGFLNPARNAFTSIRFFPANCMSFSEMAPSDVATAKKFLPSLSIVPGVTSVEDDFPDAFSIDINSSPTTLAQENTFS